MTNDQVAAFIGRHAAAWNERNPAALCSHHAEDGVVLSPMFHRVEGRDRICRTYEELFVSFPDWQLRYDEPIKEGTRVVAFFSVTATHLGDFMGVPGSRRRCTFEGVSLFDLDSDLLIRLERRVYDFTGLLVQLGVMRIRPTV